MQRGKGRGAKRQHRAADAFSQGKRGRRATGATAGGARAGHGPSSVGSSGGDGGLELGGATALSALGRLLPREQVPAHALPMFDLLTSRLPAMQHKAARILRAVSAADAADAADAGGAGAGAGASTRPLARSRPHTVDACRAWAVRNATARAGEWAARVCRVLRHGAAPLPAVVDAEDASMAGDAAARAGGGNGGGGEQQHDGGAALRRPHVPPLGDCVAMLCATLDLAPNARPVATGCAWCGFVDSAEGDGDYGSADVERCACWHVADHADRVAPATDCDGEVPASHGTHAMCFRCRDGADVVADAARRELFASLTEGGRRAMVKAWGGPRVRAAVEAAEDRVREALEALSAGGISLAVGDLPLPSGTGERRAMLARQAEADAAARGGPSGAAELRHTLRRIGGALGVALPMLVAAGDGGGGRCVRDCHVAVRSSPRVGAGAATGASTKDAAAAAAAFSSASGDMVFPSERLAHQVLKQVGELYRKAYDALCDERRVHGSGAVPVAAGDVASVSAVGLDVRAGEHSPSLRVATLGQVRVALDPDLPLSCRLAALEDMAEAEGGRLLAPGEAGGGCLECVCTSLADRMAEVPYEDMVRAWPRDAAASAPEGLMTAGERAAAEVARALRTGTLDAAISYGSRSPEGFARQFNGGRKLRRLADRLRIESSAHAARDAAVVSGRLMADIELAALALPQPGGAAQRAQGAGAAVAAAVAAAAARAE